MLTDWEGIAFVIRYELGSMSGGWDSVCHSPVATWNLASIDYFLFEKFPVAYAMIQGWYEVTPHAVQMLSVKVLVQRHLLVVQQLPEPSIRSFHASNLLHASGRLCAPIPIVLICQDSLTSGEPLCALLYHIGNCAPHPAGFVIFAQLAKLGIFIILNINIHLIVGTCKITQTISDSNHHFLKCCSRLCHCQSCVFAISLIFLLLLNRCICVFNSHFCHSGVSLDIILDPFLFLFIA